MPPDDVSRSRSSRINIQRVLDHDGEMAEMLDSAKAEPPRATVRLLADHASAVDLTRSDLRARADEFSRMAREAREKADRGREAAMQAEHARQSQERARMWARRDQRRDGLPVDAAVPVEPRAPARAPAAPMAVAPVFPAKPAEPKAAGPEMVEVPGLGQLPAVIAPAFAKLVEMINALSPTVEPPLDEAGEPVDVGDALFRPSPEAVQRIAARFGPAYAVRALGRLAS